MEKWTCLKMKILKIMFQKNSGLRPFCYELSIFDTGFEIRVFFTSSCKILWRLMHWECVWRQKYIFSGKIQKDVSISWKTRLNTHFERPGVSKNNSPCHFPSDFIYWSTILTIEKCFFDVTKFFLLRCFFGVWKGDLCNCKCKCKCKRKCKCKCKCINFV